MSRRIVKFLHAYRLIEKKRIFLDTSSDGIVLFDKILPAVLFIGAKVVVSLFRGFGQPVTFLVGRAVFPAVRQIGGAKFLGGDGESVQKLIIQFRVWLCFRFVGVGDVERVMVFFKDRPIVLPRHVVLPKPAKALEHCSGQNNVDLIYRVTDSVNVRDIGTARASHKILEIHLVQHPFDEGHTNLK